ncbi:MAG: hypothetical protein ACJA02_000883 [Myxococcota bacterium]|jgi:hypothetical protein
MNGCIIKTFLIIATLFMAFASFSNIKEYFKGPAAQKIQSMKTKATIAKKMFEHAVDKKSKKTEQ